MRESKQEDLSRLSFAQKKDLLVRLLQEKQQPEAKAAVTPRLELPRIKPRPAERYKPFPLTDIQHAYWIGRMGAFQLGNVGTHVYLEFDLPSLDSDRLQRAWQRLIERHDMLRAIIQPDGSQRILEEVPPYRIETIDLRGFSAQESERMIKQNRKRMSHKLYRADRWPLFELRAFRLGEATTRYCISFDMLIMDLMSFQILLREWLQLYQDLDAALPSLEVTFRDYVLTEIQFRKSQAYEAARDYWWKRAQSMPAAPSLPMAKPPGALTQYRFERTSAVILKDRWSRLKERARRLGLTPSSVLLAAFAETLTAWSKEPCFTLNLIIFNRFPFHPQINRIVGDFTSIVLLEVDHSAEEPFEDRARRIQTQVWADFEHRCISGVEVIREMARLHGWERAAMPVVFTCDIVQGTGAEDTFEADLPVEIAYGISQTPQVWLDHQVFERAGSLLMNWDAVKELFHDEVLEEMFAANVRLLERLADDEQSWRETSCGLTPRAQIRQRAEVNNTRVPILDEMLHTLFLAQARRRPAQPAVVAQDRTLSYQELSRRSGRLSRQLQSLGAAVNKLVAVVMDKGWEQVVAVLGILQSGAAYLPIDPDLPRERRWYLLDNGKVTLAVTQPWLDDTLEWPDSVQRICADGEPAAEADRLAAQPVQQPGDLAYVIYTSGSTGLPKGVMIDHRGAVNTICDINRRFGVGPQDRVLALSALSFDLSVYDIFGTLAAGGTVIMPEAASRRDPARWADLMESHQVTVWNSAPALMQMCADYLASQAAQLPRSLRLVLLSGDWIPVSLPDRIRSLLDGGQIVSLGGATEASIWSVLYPIASVDPSWDSIPYGKPMSNQRLHVLNQRLEPCPAWVPGQLHIGGVGVAQGYWRDPEKTAAAFLQHPRTGERLYATGDLACCLPDGNVKFLGREDHQVQISGHRIELGEIEATLEQHPEVRAAVAVAVGDPHQKKGLVAYVTANEIQPSTLFEQETAPVAEIELLWQSLLRQGGQQAEQMPLAASEELTTLMRQLEDVSTLSMCQALSSLGAFSQVNEKTSMDRLLDSCGILPRYEKLLKQWLSSLKEEGILEQLPDGRIARIASWPDRSQSELWGEIESCSKMTSEAQDLLLYSRQSAANLADMLTGSLDPLELFFPGGSWERAESLYEFNPAADYVNGIAREILRKRGQLPSSEPQLRILEIGAGTGGTTSSLLPALPPDQTRYVYSDLSVFFTNRAKQKFASYPFVEYALLDIDERPDLQGFERHSFDAIVAANVLHDARDLGTSLRYVRDLLAPCGILLAIEGTRNTRLQMVTVGLLEGLSRYEDDRRRKNLPFLSVDAWRQVLFRNGFEAFAALPEAGSQAEAIGVHAIMARAPACTRRFKKEILIRHLTNRLPAHSVPSDILLLKELPLSPNGKVDRNSLPTAEREAVRKRRTYAAPRTRMERMLAELWSTVFGVDRVGIHDNFFELGGDSLMGIQLVAAAQDAGLRIEPRELFQRQTIAELAPLIEKQQQTAEIESAPPSRPGDSAPSACLVRLASGTSTLNPLFCVHPSTGNVDCYLELAHSFDPAQPIYGLQSPSATDLPDQAPQVEKMAAEYVEAIQRVQPNGPYFLGGWSMGGILAFEMAQQLVSRGQEVGLLALLDIGVEDFRQTDTEGTDSSFLTALFEEMAVASRAKKRRISAREKVQRLVDQAQAAYMLPSGLEMFRLRKYLGLSKQNIRAMQQYKPSLYPRPITLLRAKERPLERSANATLGWDSLAKGGVGVHEVPGNHFSMLRKPLVATTAQVLSSCIAAAADWQTQIMADQKQ